MTSPLLSVLIATRGRAAKLAKTVDSLFAISDPAQFEILFRADEDDLVTVAELERLTTEHQPNIRYLSGSRLCGYPSHPEFMEELVTIAAGQWLLFFDDDAVLLQPTGTPWLEQLAAVPTQGRIVHPEFYWLDNCRYGSGSCVPVSIILPHGCWRHYDPQLHYPIDEQLQTLLASQGWQNHFLQGLILHHEHANDGGGRWAPGGQ